MEEYTIYINRKQLTALLLDNTPFIFSATQKPVGAYSINNAQHLFRESSEVANTTVNTYTFFADLTTPAETVRCKVVVNSASGVYYLGQVFTQVAEEISDLNLTL